MKKDNNTDFPITKRSKETADEFAGTLACYKFKIGNEFFASKENAEAKREELIAGQFQVEIKPTDIMFEPTKKSDRNDELEKEIKKFESDFKAEFESGVLPEDTPHFENDDNGYPDYTKLEKKQPEHTADRLPLAADLKSYEGYFKPSKISKTFVAIVVENQRNLIVIGNDITEKGFYECTVKPMFSGKGYLVVTFKRNLEKEAISRREHFARIDAETDNKPKNKLNNKPEAFHQWSANIDKINQKR